MTAPLIVARKVLSDFRLVQAARQISAGIAGQWELPPAIVHAIAHIGDAVTPAASLPAALGEADGLAKLHMLAQGGQPAFVAAVAALPDGRIVVASNGWLQVFMPF